MRAAIYVVLNILLASALPVQAQEVQIQTTIQTQIDAFKADDFDTAFNFASPMIHDIFQTPANFGAMVSTGYPMVINPAQVEMQDLRTVGGALWQRVRITDQQGHAYLLDYQMIEGPKGWLINAVQMQKAPDVGA